MKEPVATAPGSPSPNDSERAVERHEGEDHAHRNHRPGDGVAGGGGPVGDADGAGPAEAAGVRHDGATTMQIPTVKAVSVRLLRRYSR